MTDLSYIQQSQRAAVLAALTLIMVASSGCAGVIISRRYAQEPNCAAEMEGDTIAARPGRTFAFGAQDTDDDGSVRRGIPVAVWPQVKLPRCLSRETRGEMHNEMRDLLQPEPAPPLKPPHSRFHPLPTQPVFAQRLEYAPPELLETAPSHGAPPELIGAPSVEEIPVPEAEGVPLGPAPGSGPLPKPIVQPGAPNVLPQARPMNEPPATPPAGDASRGSVAPATFQWIDEPNPLRTSQRAASNHWQR